MKKTTILALVLVLIASIAVPVYAAPASPTATPEDLKPVVVPVEGSTLEVMTPEEVEENLSEEAKEVFVAAKEALVEAAPKDMAVKYLVYCETEEPAGAVFDLSDYVKDDEEGALVVMQFVDGKWVQLVYIINADGTVTVEGIVAGPLAIFVKAA